MPLIPQSAVSVSAQSLTETGRAKRVWQSPQFHCRDIQFLCSVTIRFPVMSHAVFQVHENHNGHDSDVSCISSSTLENPFLNFSFRAAIVLISDLHVFQLRHGEREYQKQWT